MRIPKRFVLKGKQWKTARKKKLADDDDTTGFTIPDDKLIEIRKDVDAKHLPWIFWHEFCHALLDEASVTRNTGGISELAEEIICDNFADFMTSGQIEIKWKQRKK